MIHPALQGQGLGKAMQQVMAAHAAGRRVRVFVADIRATNAPMIRLAQAASAQVRTESEGGTVRVTALF
ncbi:MAG: GNAT family N-acetyltransferase [Rubrivivax sp.]